MSRASRGRHEGPRRAKWPVRVAVVTVLAILVLVTVVVSGVPWSGDGGRESAAGSCDADAPPVRIGADPAIADVLADATRDLEPWLEPGDCLTVTVQDVESGETAAQLTRDAGTGFAAPLPDIWVPDSSLWLAVATATETGQERLPGTTTPIASSPVVAAIPAAVADRAGWPEWQPSWEGLLSEPDGSVAITDPRTDAAALATLLDIRAERQESLAEVARSFRVPLTPGGPTTALAASGSVRAIPTSEVAVIRTNEAPGPVSVVAGYDQSLTQSLDFPLVAVAPEGGELPDTTARAEEILQDLLLDETTQQMFSDAGFRGPDGTLAATWGEQAGVLDRPSAAAAYPPAQVRSVVQQWTSVGRRFRLLMLVDRSGSMAQSLPDSDASKAELAQSALDTLVRGLAPDSDMGLWAFTSGLPDGDTEELVATAPVGTDRDALLAGVEQLDPVLGGATPLYDAVLAGFRAAQRDFSYGRLNALVVVSDGRNLDSPSISLPELLDALRLEFDGVRPVRILTVAYGAGADATTLRRISSVTGGRSYRALDESDISRVLRRAVQNL